MEKIEAFKVIAVGESYEVVANYVFAFQEEADMFYKDMTSKGYDCICFKVDV